MKKYIEVYPNGTKVQIITPDEYNLKGQITRISLIGNFIDGLVIMYEVSYYLNNQYYIHHFYDYQLNFDPNAKKEKVGFKELKD
jgi:hypothetical protein